MPSEKLSQSKPDPALFYTERLQALDEEQQRQRRLERSLGMGKLVAALLCVVCGFVLVEHQQLIAWIFLPVVILATLVVLHEKLLRRIAERTRRIDFCLRGLDRIHGKWAGKGESGDRFLDDQHPYARDLDLFGRASLFELLCTARTRMGEETLAAWLLTPAAQEEVLARQQAIHELREHVEDREQLFLLGTALRVGVRPEKLARWGEKQGIFPERWLRITTVVLAVFWLLGLVVWGLTQNALLVEVFTALNLLWAKRIYRNADEAAEQIEEAAADLKLLAGVLAISERQCFTSAKLTALQQRLRRQGMPPSAAIHRLERIARALESRRNLVLRIPDLLLFWSAQLIFAAEAWQRQYGAEIRGWLNAVGEYEALQSMAAYAWEHAGDSFAEVVAQADGALFHAERMTHPLLPADHAVRNDVMIGADMRLIVLSGPNMAGKSTFIRSVGVNAVLALAGAPVRAKKLCISEVQVAASLCILDSLSGGISRFYAEIHRVKLIADLASGTRPVLFLLDELLSGTNSHDRLAGTEYVVRSLLGHGAMGIVSTHDLALTRIPEKLTEPAVNMHFEDRLENGRMLFDYKLRPGIVQTSNALELMRSIGLGVERSE